MSSTRSAPLPETAGDPMPEELKVVEHNVGYTEVVLANGDRLRLHLFVHTFHYSAEEHSYSPEFRVVSERQPRAMTPVQIQGTLEGCWRC